MPYIYEHSIRAKVTKSRKGILSRDTQGSNLKEGIKAKIIFKSRILIRSIKIIIKKKRPKPYIYPRLSVFKTIHPKEAISEGNVIKNLSH